MNDHEILNLSIADFGENRNRNSRMISAIENGLTEYNWSLKPDPSASRLVLAIESEGAVIAGVLGRSAYGWMRVDVIWVDESLRGKGHGERLMGEVERIALERACIGVHLDTHGFQAPGFYLKLGYEIFGELPNYPEGESHYYLKKELVDAGV